jgi:anti-anti-sigma factor
MCWFSSRAKYDSPGDRPQIVAPADTACCASTAVSAVEVSINHTADALVIRIGGEAGVECAGAIVDSLLAPSACRPRVVTLDLSELRSISCLALGVLVAYVRGVVRAGGGVHLAEKLQPAVRESLVRSELFDLLEATGNAEPMSKQERGPTAVLEEISEVA